jgi:hypothetical protein
MAKITLDIGHALSREDQRQNRRNPVFVSQSCSSYVFLRKSRREVLKKNARRETEKTLTLFFAASPPVISEIEGSRAHAVATLLWDAVAQ